MTELTLDKIYEQYYDRVFSYIRARISSFADAEDIASDVFCKIVANISTYDSEKASLSTWVFTIANNTMRDYIRSSGVKNRRVSEADEDFFENIISDDDTPDERLLNNEMLELLAEALEQLSERERMIVCMHYYNGVPHKEIAEKMNLSYSNVRYINHKAIEKLGQFFHAYLQTSNTL